MKTRFLGKSASFAEFLSRYNFSPGLLSRFNSTAFRRIFSSLLFLLKSAQKLCLLKEHTSALLRPLLLTVEFSHDRPSRDGYILYEWRKLVRLVPMSYNVRVMRFEKKCKIRSLLHELWLLPNNGNCRSSPAVGRSSGSIWNPTLMNSLKPGSSRSFNANSAFLMRVQMRSIPCSSCSWSDLRSKGRTPLNR